MLLCHVVDDFVLQPICLSKLKCQGEWKTWTEDRMYKYDYLMALFIHAMSWSIMIHLPLMLMVVIPSGKLFLSVSINLVIHFIIDDLKANRHRLNLIEDQLIHLVQIFGTFLILY